MSEQWRDIPGWIGYYQASDMGQIRSVNRIVPHARGDTHKLKGKILQPSSSNSSGYLIVNLSLGGIKWSEYVHRLVASTWIGPVPVGQRVRHGPNGYLDNSVGNLCYGTPSQDQLDRRRDGTHLGKAVRCSDGMEFINMHVAAEESNCSSKHIWAVCNSRYKSADGYDWEYADIDPNEYQDINQE